MRPRDILVIASFAVRRTLRSVHGMLFLAFFVTFFAWVGTKVYSVTSSLRELDSAGARAAALSEDNPFYDLAAWLTNLSGDAIRQLVVDHPPALVGLFFVALFALPFFAMLAAFDQTASDISSKHARYLLLRTDRTSLYVGKTIGTTVFLAGALALVTFLIGLMVLFIGGASGTSMASAFLYLIRIWLSLVFFSLPFIALLGVANALIGHAFLSLLAVLGLYFFIWAGTAIGGIAYDNIEYVAYIFPTAFKFHIMSPDSADIIKAIAHQGGFAVVLFFAGLALFRRRDL